MDVGRFKLCGAIAFTWWFANYAATGMVPCQAIESFGLMHLKG